MFCMLFILASDRQKDLKFDPFDTKKHSYIQEIESDRFRKGENVLFMLNNFYFDKDFYRKDVCKNL